MCLHNARRAKLFRNCLMKLFRQTWGRRDDRRVQLALANTIWRTSIFSALQNPKTPYKEDAAEGTP